MYRIPCASESVLEIGCGTGALGRHTERNSNVTYIGVEIEKEAGKAKHMDHVFICDVEQNNLNTKLNSSDRYDCIIFGDVLEHLRMQKLITELLPYLKKDG